MKDRIWHLQPWRHISIIHIVSRAPRDTGDTGQINLHQPTVLVFIDLLYLQCTAASRWVVCTLSTQGPSVWTVSWVCESWAASIVRYEIRLCIRWPFRDEMLSHKPWPRHIALATCVTLERFDPLDIGGGACPHVSGKLLHVSSAGWSRAGGCDTFWVTLHSIKLALTVKL